MFFFISIKPRLFFLNFDVYYILIVMSLINLIGFININYNYPTKNIFYLIVSSVGLIFYLLNLWVILSKKKFASFSSNLQLFRVYLIIFPLIFFFSNKIFVDVMFYLWIVFYYYVLCGFSQIYLTYYEGNIIPDENLSRYT